MRCSYLLVAASVSLVVAGDMSAQNPATIPTVVAEATNPQSMMYGKPTYFDGVAPTDWPKELIPAGARVLGGAAQGLMGGMRVQSVVLAFPRGADPGTALRELLRANGFRTAEDMTGMLSTGGGFMSTMERSIERPRYCKAPYAASFVPVDSTRDPLVFAMYLNEGAGSLSACNGRRPDEAMMRGLRDDLTVPPLVAPTGAQWLGGGSSGGGDERTMHSTVIASMSSDSLLSHYSRQLAAAGWKVVGSPASVPSLAMQRFEFTKGQEKWTARLVVISTDNHHEVMIYMNRTG